MLGSAPNSPSLISKLSPRSFRSTSPSTTKPLARSSTRDTRSPRCRSGSVIGSSSRAFCLRYSATSSRLKHRAALAAKGAEELEGSAPPCALVVCASFIRLRGHNVQDARKFSLVLLFHRAWSDNQRTHNQRRERDAATYMQRSWTELKNCSIWLRNSIGDVRLESEKSPAG